MRTHSSAFQSLMDRVLCVQFWTSKLRHTLESVRMIKAPCTGCGFVYRVGDDKAGRRFKCRQCDEVIRVADGRRGPSQQRKDSSRERPAKAASQSEWEESDQYTYQEYDDYESYESYGDTSYDYDDSYEEYRPARARRSTTRKKKNRTSRTSRKNESSEISFASPLVWLGFPILSWLIAIAVTFVIPTAGLVLMTGLVIAGYVISMIAGLRSLVVAFREDLMCGVLYLFLPFYSLYHMITRWEDHKSPFWMGICGVLLIIGAAFGFPALQQVREIIRKREVAVVITVPTPASAVDTVLSGVSVFRLAVPAGCAADCRELTGIFHTWFIEQAVAMDCVPVKREWKHNSLIPRHQPVA